MSFAQNTYIHLAIALTIIGLLGIITLVLVAITLGTNNKKYDNLNEQMDIFHHEISDLNNRLSTSTSTSTTTSISTSVTSSFEPTTILKSTTRKSNPTTNTLSLTSDSIN